MTRPWQSISARCSASSWLAIAVAGCFAAERRGGCPRGSRDDVGASTTGAHRRGVDPGRREHGGRAPGEVSSPRRVRHDPHRALGQRACVGRLSAAVDQGAGRGRRARDLRALHLGARRRRPAGGRWFHRDRAGPADGQACARARLRHGRLPRRPRRPSGRFEPDDVQRQIAAVGQYGMALPAAEKRYGVVGFCWGGGVSFASAVESPSGQGAAVVYYGTSPATASLARVKVPVLGLYGGEDARVGATVPPADSAMKALGKRFEPHTLRWCRTRIPAAAGRPERRQSRRRSAGLAAHASHSSVQRSAAEPMTFLFLAAFIAGLLLGVRVMFFGAERRRLRPADAMPLRRSEPAIVGFLLMFGVAGYLLTRHGTMSAVRGRRDRYAARARLGRAGHARRGRDGSPAARARSRRSALRASGTRGPGRRLPFPRTAKERSPSRMRERAGRSVRAPSTELRSPKGRRSASSASRTRWPSSSSGRSSSNGCRVADACWLRRWHGLRIAVAGRRTERSVLAGVCRGAVCRTR